MPVLNPPDSTVAAEALLLSVGQAAALCGIGEATWWRHHSAGKVPAPVRLGGRTLWSRTTLVAWIAVGCPARATWDAMQRANGTHNGRR